MCDVGLRPHPTQRQRRLGLELRRLREESGFSAAEAGRTAGLGAAHMSHIETGRTAIPEPKLRVLADTYGCKDKPLVDALVTMGKSTGRGWWTEFRPTMTDPALDLAEVEATSVAHRNFQWLHVPGLLQTEEYMRASFEGVNPMSTAAERDLFATFRLRRQEELRRNESLAYHAVIHEAALRMQFFSRDVMRGQIEHLVEVSRAPNVTVQLLPFQAQSYEVAFSTPFVVYEASVPALHTVYVEHPVSSPFLSEQQHLAMYCESFDRLSKAALPPVDVRSRTWSYGTRDSLALIQHLLYTL
ncbi:DUF5753 domain-containing protein [Streptomyces sp. NPDC087440]|uniref:DUF5753 domain-containing protein n=1 Tax=Streptomyces sp. NPDC087440 TaxID=3365790 RepID=UPI0038239F8A